MEEEDVKELINGDTDDEVSVGNDLDDFENRFVRSWVSEDGTRRYFHHTENGRVRIRYIMLPCHPFYNRSRRDRVNVDFHESIRVMRMEQIVNEE